MRKYYINITIITDKMRCGEKQKNKTKFMGFRKKTKIS